MNRRSFLRSITLLAGSLSLPSLLQACGLLPPEPEAADLELPAAQPEPTLQPTAGHTSTAAAGSAPASAPTATPDPDVARIALVKTSDRATGIRQSLELLGINPASGRHVLLKPNFNSADSSPGSTHNDTLQALLLLLNEMGAASITIADRSGMGDTRQVMQQKGIFDLAEQYGAAVQVLDELPEEKTSLVPGEGTHWPAGFPLPGLLLGSDCVVQTCNLKTHGYGGHFTMSLKNSVGFVMKQYKGHNYMNDLHGSPYQRLMIAEINTQYQPALIVLDGVQAFLNGGPHAGTIADTQLILAGTDRVAIDAAGVAVLRLFGTTPEVSRGRVFEQEQIARAVELGLGVSSPDKINFLTADEPGAAYAAQIREVMAA